MNSLLLAKQFRLSTRCFRALGRNVRFASDVTTLNSDSDVAESDDDAQVTGVINKTNEETLLYFDHILPIKTSKWDFRQQILQILGVKRESDLKSNVMSLAQSKDSPITGLEMTSFVPLNRDGGAFVKFSVPEGYSPQDLNKIIQANTKQKSRKSLFNVLTKPACYSVKGVPWIEDLRRYPSPKLKIIFEGPHLSEEELYVLFRRYGKIIDIIPAKPVKDTPVTASVVFHNLRSAVSAKNCITGIHLGESTLHIQYEPIARVNIVKDSIINHTRISVPLILAFLATAAVLIFDPIREWFVEQKITHTFSLNTYKNNRFVKFLYDAFTNASSIIKSNSYFGFHKSQDSSGLEGVWTERFDSIKQLKLWFDENIGTFIIVKGPRGSGKHELVMEHVLNDRNNVLLLDCDKLIKSRSDTSLMKNTAHQLGYFPVFPWVNSVSSYIDLGVQGLTGQKSGLSESKETSIKNMFSLATQSIRNIALYGYSEAIKSDENIKEEDYLQQHPECKPVIVIDRFLRKAENNDFIYKLISDWAASLISMNVAHVVFITDDVGSIQHLSDALPNQVFKTVTLSDASQASSIQYVMNQVGDGKHTIQGLDEAIAPLGGRMLDLQAFSRRVKSGESPSEALDEMITQSAEQITQMFISRPSNEWSSAQVWEIMKLLTVYESVPYSSLYRLTLFKADPNSVLAALEKNELITLVREKGVLKSIRPGKPLYRAAFANLVQDGRIFRILETDYLTTLISTETANIKKFETELESFSKFVDPKPFKTRITYLSDKISISTNNILEYEKKVSQINK